MAARLIGVKGTLLGRTMALGAGETIIGREPTCGVPLAGGVQRQADADHPIEYDGLI